jgi:MATE family multidrug resistance protein
MMVVMAGSTLLVFLPTFFGLAQFGNHALWLAFTLFMAARGIGMHAWFRRLVAQDALVSDR